MLEGISTEQVAWLGIFTEGFSMPVFLWKNMNRSYLSLAHSCLGSLSVIDDGIFPWDNRPGLLLYSLPRVLIDPPSQVDATSNPHTVLLEGNPAIFCAASLGGRCDVATKILLRVQKRTCFHKAFGFILNTDLFDFLSNASCISLCSMAVSWKAAEQRDILGTLQSLISRTFFPPCSPPAFIC